MKKIYALVLALIPTTLFSQTIFWTEDFGTGCNQGQDATSYSGSNGAWTVTNTGNNYGGANKWYISAMENGNAVGQCGSSCGSNRTLHISSTIQLGGPQPDSRANYYVGGDESVCAFLPAFCGGTDKRIESPVINCSDYTSLIVDFTYLEGGTGAGDDNGTLWYFDGSSWTQLADMASTTNGCPTNNGMWTNFSIALPASANGNANVKVGFRWINNDNASYNDPSIAIDNVTVKGTPTGTTCCPGDFNCDGVINVLDMIIIVNQFGCSGGACTADLDNDGIIGAADLTIFNGLYGDICP